MARSFKHAEPASTEDVAFLRETIELGRRAASEGNLPIGAVIVVDNAIVATGLNGVLAPSFHPGRHAEVRALEQVDGSLLLNRSHEMTLFSNIEPCVMCLGAIVLHRIGRVVFGARDPNRGATFLLTALTQIYRPEQLPTFVGPALEDECGPMFRQADTIYRLHRRA